MAALTVRDLRKTYHRVSGEDLQVLDGISFSVADGEFVCLLGPSGCGKTTILNALANLIDYEGGIRLCGRTDGSPARIGYVFQTPRLLPWKTVAANIDFALRSSGPPHSNRAETVVESLRVVGLLDCASSYPHELSQGMQARVGLARALATQPDILLMDEPFGHVDEITARGLRWELQDICSRVSMTAVFVTHNPREAAFLADRILVLSSVPARMTGELSVTLARPRTPESTQLATVVASIYGLLDRDNRGNSR